MSTIGCPSCGNANKAESQFCEKCSASLPQQPAQQQTNQPKQRSPLKKLGIFGGIGCLGFLVLSIVFGSLGLLDNKNKNQADTKQEQTATASKTDTPQPSDTKQSGTGTTEATNSAFTDKEYEIYQEVIKASASESEDQAINRIAKRNQMTPQEVKEISQRVIKQLYSGGKEKNKSNEQAIRAAIEPLARIKTILVNSEFVSVVYIDNSKALNEADMRKKVLAGMPKILEAALSVPDIRRVRLIANFPTMDGGETKVASFEANRSEFQPNKRPQEYEKFWVK